MALDFDYGETLDAGRPGAIADMRDKTLISRTAEGVVGFGAPLAQGTADRQARVTTTGDTVVLGVSVMDRSVAGGEFADGEEVRVMTEGAVWVTAVATVAAGDPVHVIVADATFSNTGGVAIEGARYEDSGGAGDVVTIALK